MKLPLSSKCAKAPRKRRLVALGVAAADAVALRLKGGRWGGDVVVRCRQGHLFTTIWIPAASVKSVRLGWWRLQRCPVGRHWSLVTPVRESDLNARQRRAARKHRDVRLP